MQQDGKKTGQDGQRREAGWAWDSTADERRQHEGSGGCGKEDRRLEAVGVSQGTQHNETKVRLAVAPRR
jgi:hypothetical protein